MATDPGLATAADALAAQAHDLSMMALFLQADPIVKGVMLLLGLASVICWAIILDKVIRVVQLRREARRLENLARSQGLASETWHQGVVGAVIGAAVRERQDRSEPGETRAAYRDRLERAMRHALADELRRVEPGLPFLATVGSAGPFIGLFGTVWGIMNSFTAIAASNDTSLAVVAPGIAEALFATAIGLAAAIPAVIAYNKLTTALGRAAQRMHASIGLIGSRLAREPALAEEAVAWR
ncbi:MAG TPA: MotA/TolQ/ExbB proton channel family protein [Geminicoccaceae bacterium]|nr:MotA/TolQ/ExbB proton channel family protein [Geminicoccus sp.]HMU50801.1 MotA/TolQ/ExbB proton channel family protein [Geminicoccaceae bacterium]